MDIGVDTKRQGVETEAESVARLAREAKSARWATVFHVVCVAVVALLAGLTWWNVLPAVLAKIAVFLVDLYLVLVLIEAAKRSEGQIKDGVRVPLEKWIFPSPSRSWSLLVVLLLVFIAVSAFAALYISSGQVLAHAGVTLTGPLDAFYFSLVTITTLGYGDFAPSGDARLLVVWQLATGLLLLVGIFPFVVSRVADF